MTPMSAVTGGSACTGIRRESRGRRISGVPGPSALPGPSGGAAGPEGELEAERDALRLAAMAAHPAGTGSPSSTGSHPCRCRLESRRDYPGASREADCPVARVSDSGMVTAELAVSLPILAFLAVAMSWVIALGVGQGQLLVGAREGARAAARGDSDGKVVAAVYRVAPHAEVVVARGSRTVRVRLSQRREPPGMLSGLGYTLRAQAVAAVEP